MQDDQLNVQDDDITLNTDPALSNNQQGNISGQDIPFSISLIEEFGHYPCIWNISLSSHKDKPKKQEAWRRISSALNVPGIYKITTLYVGYSNENCKFYTSSHTFLMFL